MIQSGIINAVYNRSDAVVWMFESDSHVEDLSLVAAVRCKLILRRDGRTDEIIDSLAHPTAFQFTSKIPIRGRLTRTIRWVPGEAVIGELFEEDLYTVDVILYDQLDFDDGEYVGTFRMRILDPFVYMTSQPYPVYYQENAIPALGIASGSMYPGMFTATESLLSQVGITSATLQNVTYINTTSFTDQMTAAVDMVSATLSIVVAYKTYSFTDSMNSAVSFQSGSLDIVVSYVTYSLTESANSSVSIVSASLDPSGP